MSTHQQLLYHIVFSTKNRKKYLLDENFRKNTFAYMAGIVSELGGMAIRIGGYYDHVHLLVRIPAKVSVSEFAGKLKGNTSRHINDTSKSVFKFGWQDGFGAFTVSPSQQDRVIRYIENQMEHHRDDTFEDEYLRLLNKHEIEYDPDFVFD